MRPRATLRNHHRAFTVVEFLVCVGVLALLLSIFIPFAVRKHEMSNRIRCARNLATFNVVLQEYAKVNNYLLPSVIHDTEKPNGYTAFTGPDDPNPFAPGSKVQPNDVTASLFLLVRGGYLAQNGGLSLFICPSSSDAADPLTDAAGHAVPVLNRSNFRAPTNLSYGYCSPFSSAAKFRMNTDWLAPGAAVMADKGPGIGAGSDVLGPAPNAPPLDMRWANSNNHGQAGQNVLHGDGHVDFQRTPFCGYRDFEGPGDNIYTAAAAKPSGDAIPTQPAKGFFGRGYAPSAWGDSYLVPSEHDRD